MIFMKSNFSQHSCVTIFNFIACLIVEIAVRFNNKFNQGKMRLTAKFQLCSFIGRGDSYEVNHNFQIYKKTHNDMHATYPQRTHSICQRQPTNPNLRAVSLSFAPVLWPPSDLEVRGRKEKERRRKNNAKFSGHYVCTMFAPKF